ncbi:MAG: crossover junction endodeoxyribonuclease RuvC [Chitinophagales bacterium]
MGVDPGTNILGYSIICVEKNVIKILANGVVHLKKTDDHFIKLRSIYDHLYALIVSHKPTVLAIEAPFFAKNVQSMLKLGRAQGAAMLAAAHHELEVKEYSPRKIKQSITGKGNASKEQVARMLQSILQLSELPEYFDETDALAAAICYVNSTKKIIVKTTSFNSWNAYVKSNPAKIAKR